MQAALTVEARRAALGESAQDPAIRNYLRRMQAELERALAAERRLVAGVHRGAVDSEMSRQIDLESQAAERAIVAARGESFETTFLSRDVALQTKILHLIDDELLTAVRDPAQRDELLRVRPLVARRLALSSRFLEWRLTQPP